MALNLKRCVLGSTSIEADHRQKTQSCGRHAFALHDGWKLVSHGTVGVDSVWLARVTAYKASA